MTTGHTRSSRNRQSSASPARRTAILYTRVSSREQQEEGFSLDAQLRTLRDYAAANHLHVAEEFLDVESAHKTGRRRFNEMVRHLRRLAPAKRLIIVEKTDRLYRNIKDWVTIDEVGAEVHLVREGAVLSTDSRSAEKFMHGIKVLMAKNY